MAKVKAKDHLGNIYPSKTVMCEAWNIPANVYRSRRDTGWDLEKALTTPHRKQEQIKDHLGKVYTTFTAMCRAYHIDPETVKSRLEAGKPLEQALTVPVLSAMTQRVGERKMMNCGEMAEIIAYKNADDITVRFDSGIVREHMVYARFQKGYISNGKTRRKLTAGIEDHKGNKYGSKEEMCKAYNIQEDTYDYRIHQNWSKEAALTTPVLDRSAKTVKDHLNREYESIAEMCRAWGISTDLYRNREKLDWDLERILTTPAKIVKQPVTDHLGVVYESKTEMLRAYGIDRATFHDREQKNWDLERILTTPTKSVQTVEDHLGNVFRNKQAMVAYYGINISVFDSRRMRGWGLKEALTTPTKDVSAWRETYIGKRFLTNCGLYVRVTDIADVNHITVVFEDIGEEHVVARKELDKGSIAPFGLSLMSCRTHTFCGFQMIGHHGYYPPGCTQMVFDVYDPELGEHGVLTAPMMVQIWKERERVAREEVGVEVEDEVGEEEWELE